MQSDPQMENSSDNPENILEKREFVDGVQQWNFVFWIIIVCGITTVVMQTIAIVEITTRQKR